ncbi:MAG TPA: hypothetical protein VJ792_04385 [Candidatus Nitrosotalea sp.]|nr:hypothetical protein [Candidatus Nitrosotalea sp.]
MTNLRHEDQEPKDLLPFAFVLGMVAIVAVMSTMVWPIWNLFPQYVTEQVKVVSVDQSGVWADTQDNYLVKLSGTYHNVQPGQHIMGTYDVKIKNRMNTFG